MAMARLTRLVVAAEGTKGSLWLWDFAQPILMYDAAAAAAAAAAAKAGMQLGAGQ